MRRERQLYQAGDEFLIPLRNGRFVLGLVARTDGQGGVLGYFFLLPQDATPPVRPITPMVTPILVKLFGDLRIVNGDWPVLGKWQGFRPEEWPMPAFGQRELITNRAFKVEYDETTFQPTRRTVTTLDELARLPRDGVAGAEALEIRLSNLADDVDSALRLEGEMKRPIA